MMEEGEEAVQHAEAFPPPPAFFKLYGDAASPSAPLPPEPPQPVDGIYQMFGELSTTEDGLPPLQAKQLFRMGADGLTDFRGELRSLNRELLFQYIAAVQSLCDNPSSYTRTVESIGDISRNMHYLLNLVRPFQARATLKHMLQVETAERKKAIAECREKAQEVDRQLEELSKQLT